MTQNKRHKRHNHGGMAMDDDFMTPAAVSELTGISLGALAQMRYDRKGPRYFKPTPRSVLYRRSDIVAWVEAGERLTREFA
jgi:predicted DNA-binding transcriptional regulator AlpA